MFAWGFRDEHYRVFGANIWWGVKGYGRDPGPSQNSFHQINHQQVSVKWWRSERQREKEKEGRKERERETERETESKRRSERERERE